MPVVVIRATDLGIRGDESPGELEANPHLCDALESTRLEAGKRIGLEDVASLTIPKLSNGNARRLWPSS